MTWKPGAKAVTTILALLAAPDAAHAQRAAENAVTNADDAFGTSVGLESSGIYTEFDTRGFSPQKAGNSRLDGIYYDQVANLSGRLRAGSAIRVGFSSEDFPFHAPTGVVDSKLRPFPDKFGNSLAFNRMPFGGYIGEWDLRLPIVPGHVGLVGGLANADLRFTDGSRNRSWGWTARMIFKFKGVEVSPFAAVAQFRDSLLHPLVVVNAGYLPEMQEKRKYLGQSWALARYANDTFGATVKASISSQLSLRAGLFRSVGDRQEYYSEFFLVTAPSGLSDHRFIADPAQDIHSDSGEAQVALRLGGGGWDHRIIAGYRFRDRLTQSGGSDARNFGPVIYGELDPEPEPVFSFAPVNAGRVKQSAAMLGYLGSLKGVASINLGIQKASYHATFRDGRSGAETGERDNPWLYNATVTVDFTPSLSAYAGSERGLEDSGAAPPNAVNANEQLPATRTTQYEGGLRWKFSGGQLVASAFQITKPYFSFDTANRYSEVGQVRHRGVEGSVSAHFGKRLNLLAGVVAMQPRVSGPAHDLGLVGNRPAGTPELFARFDANYRTDIFGGLTPTASLIYTGNRPAGSRPLAMLGGKQLMLPGFAAVDLGVRQQFKLGKIPASYRIVVNNVFDSANWKVIASNTLQVDERRRFLATVTADF